MEGLVYQEFGARNIVDKMETEAVETFAGIDFGFKNPTAIAIIKKDRDDNFYIVDEWYKTGKTQDEIEEKALQMQETYQVRFWYPDPAEPDRIESMKRKGLYCREVNKDIEAGVDRVRELIKKGQLKVEKHCINTIDEFETYHYPEDDEKEDPVKANDHLMDAIRYAIYSHQPVGGRDVELEELIYKREDEY